MSITLTTPQSVVINGTTIENDTAGFVTSYSIDFIANLAYIYLNQGTVSGNVATVGHYGGSANFTVNLITGAWTASNGGAGTFSGPGLASFLSEIKADRNLMETFAAGSSGLMPGTQVAWV